MAIEFTGVSQLAAAFGRVPVELRKVLRPALLKAADIIADEARSNASWSSEIPGRISTSASISTNGGAIVRVDASGRPHVRLYEGPRDWRHPVYGNTNNWVPQSARPYLTPAVDEKRSEATEVIRGAVRSATALLR